MGNAAEWICSLEGTKERDPRRDLWLTKGIVRKDGKGAKTDSDREDFYRKGSRRGMLKILKKGKSYDFPFFMSDSNICTQNGLH